MASISIDFTGVEELTAGLNRLQLTESNVTRMIDSAVTEFYSIMENVFKSEGGRKQWKKLDAKYAERKAKEGFGGLPILQRTKLLKDSLTGKSKGTSIIKQGDTVFITVSDKVSGRFYGHQHGASRHGKLPKRTIVDFTDAEKQKILRAMIRATPLNRFMAFLGV